MWPSSTFQTAVAKVRANSENEIENYSDVLFHGVRIWKGFEATMTKKEQAVAAQTRVNRWWLSAPVIATALAAIVLVILMIPGVLMYPEDAAQPPAEAKQLAAEANTVLRQRIDDLRKALDADVCVADGQFTTPTGPLPEDLSSVLPGPPLSIVKPRNEAVDNLQSFNGSVEQLISQATVFVRVPSANNSLSTGSGVFVSKDTVLTNAHVVDGASGNTVMLYNDSMGAVSATIVTQGKSSAESGVDLAVLRVSSPPANQAFLTLADAKQGQTVTAAGFPMVVMGSDPAFVQWLNNPNAADPKKKPFVDTQILSTVQTENDGVEWLYHTATIDKGNSGGPLLDDCGFLVGINTGAASRRTDANDLNAVKIPFSKAIGRNTIDTFISDAGLPPLSGHAGSCTAVVGK